jgi:tRNA G26 N,N-dimethylase Trm1
LSRRDRHVLTLISVRLVRRPARPAGAVAMTYMHCPRCRLAIRRRVSYLTLVNCPRCLARTAIAVPLFTSPLSATELRRAPDSKRYEEPAVAAGEA